MSARVAVAVLSVVLLSGCGSSPEEAAKTATRDYFVALADGDYDRACDKLSASGKRDLAEIASVQVPELGTIRCEEVLAGLFELADEAQLDTLRDVEITGASVDGDSATVDVTGATDLVRLSRIDGDWKIAAVPPSTS